MSNDTISKVLNLPPLDLPEVERIEPDNVSDDYDYARGNMINIIEKGSEALDGILNVANQSQNPRSYEVVATIIKTMAETNKDLLELSKKKKELQNMETGNAKTINNNLFVGSTADLQKLLKNNESTVS